MQEMVHNNQTINYQIRKSLRAKRLRIAVYCDSTVVVTLPWFLPSWSAEKYLKSKLDWVVKALDFYKGKIVLGRILSKKDYLLFRPKALSLAEQKVLQWNRIFGFKVNGVNIKNQKTRWGSCSKKGNLNFNFKIVRLPEELLDYLVVHELCHLKEFNHSQKFWALVEQALPNYLALKKQLKQVII